MPAVETVQEVEQEYGTVLDQNSLDAKEKYDANFYTSVDDVKDLVAKEIAKLIQSGQVQLVDTIPETPRLPDATYKKHYRCDKPKELMIQALDFSQPRPQSFPIPGEYIVFRGGHHMTNNDNHIAQIEWMRENIQTTHDGLTVGGYPSIYEDDGGDVFRCGSCDFITGSRNGWKAHMKAQHGVEM